MHRSQLMISRSKRSRLQDQSLSTVDLLHNGLRRKISHTDYKSIYPRLKITANSQVNTFSVLKNEYDDADLYQELLKLKEDNRNLAAENDKLKAAIRRENKINQLFNKRKENIPLHAMSLEKIMELKLILESEELQQRYAEAEARLKEALEKHKNDKLALNNTTIEPQIELYCMLEEMGADMEETSNQKKEKLDKLSVQLHKLRVNSRKRKQLCKAKAEELNELSETIEREKKMLPMRYDVNISVSDSGLINRNKPIEEIEAEIVGLRSEQVRFEGELQSRMDMFIKQKLLIYKQIDETKEEIKQKCQLNVSQKGMLW